ncbi:class I SAM-dependent methyltransferase [Gramella lutea]|uniref:Class I SAM-dependent methyltransferase n=1 Tax=Christiangramia lutea TaxID=1607951 RepID=A0A9X1V616_9FLAO|nr:class I SAM-dependent methyltransferase [Christiangramia lutea]MCH4824316.1 class I SAM-dependent methyltransferase [Christiangramia lutea]
MPCSLCNCRTRKFAVINDREFLQCEECKAILLSSEYYLSPREEKSRYSLHNNDVNDPGYKAFVSPIINQVKLDFKPEANGLDFGCGTGPVITSELKKAGFKMELYDPYFQPEKKVLKNQYEFIVCCEVMEHFQDPKKEFKLLRSLLKPHGKLYCKTAILNSSIEFENWHYKNDLTHVFFYKNETLQWIKENLNFSGLKIYKNFIVFSN